MLVHSSNKIDTATLHLSMISEFFSLQDHFILWMKCLSSYLYNKIRYEGVGLYVMQCVSYINEELEQNPEVFQSFVQHARIGVVESQGKPFQY